LKCNFNQDDWIMYTIIGGDGKEYGPVSTEQLRQWIAEGRVNAHTQAQVEGGAGWQPLTAFPEFADLLGASQPSPVPVVPPLPATPPLRTPAKEISNYLIPSILCTVFCCLPTGIAAIVFAAQVNNRLRAGDLAGAVGSSNKAKLWCWVSFGLGLAINLALAIFYMVMMAGALSVIRQ
jgi:hypothetical protein